MNKIYGKEINEQKLNGQKFNGEGFTGTVMLVILLFLLIFGSTNINRLTDANTNSNPSR